jgi:hypothetical protein
MMITEQISSEMVHNFTLSPTAQVLILDMSRKDWIDLLAMLQDQIPFGLHIFMCEQVWRLPETKK